MWIQSPPWPRSKLTFTPLPSAETDSLTSKTQSQSPMELFLWEIWDGKKPTGFSRSKGNTSDTSLQTTFSGTGRGVLSLGYKTPELLKQPPSSRQLLLLYCMASAVMGLGASAPGQGSSSSPSVGGSYPEHGTLPTLAWSHDKQIISISAAQTEFIQNQDSGWLES